jgi:hypothetical protein
VIPERRTTASIAALIVNFRTAELTARAVRSCLDAGVRRVLVVDNGSNQSESLDQLLPLDRSGLAVLELAENLGFAGGVNRGILTLTEHHDWSHALLLNSDAVLTEAFPNAWEQGRGDGHLSFGAVARAADGEIESLGMTLHRSLIASERRTTQEPVLGPTGAFLIASRSLLADLEETSGSVLPAEFFCYAEDTDLCVRARLLGYEPEMLGSSAVAVHEGQASSAGKRSDFIFYHGIRNSIWMQLRTIPALSLALCSPWWLAAQAGIAVKALREGRLRLLCRIYFQTVRTLPHLLAQRRRIQRHRRISPRQFHALLARSFYDQSYVMDALRSLLSGRGR